ncbi:MAG: hypothetical protein ABI024_05135, partial [Vicinamibacterales bacterium]
VAALAGSAEAVMLSGAFGKTGSFVPVTCVAGVCTPLFSLVGATAIDFIDVVGVPTPGTPGPTVGSNATGDFVALGLNNAIGTMADFSFAGTGGDGFRLPPIATFEIFPGILTFQLTSVSITFLSAVQIGLLGTGLFTNVAGGFENTPGRFSLTGAGSQGSFSFSVTQTATPAPVPDRGSTAALLGSVLVALGVLRRKVGKI